MRSCEGYRPDRLCYNCIISHFNGSRCQQLRSMHHHYVLVAVFVFHSKSSRQRKSGEVQWIDLTVCSRARSQSAVTRLRNESPLSGSSIKVTRATTRSRFAPCQDRRRREITSSSFISAAPEPPPITCYWCGWLCFFFQYKKNETKCGNTYKRNRHSERLWK